MSAGLVLGIDPGTHACGYGLISAQGRRLKLQAFGVFRLKGALPVRLASLQTSLQALLEKWQPKEVAVEGVFSHKNARSALILGHARGVVLCCAGSAGLEVFEYAPAKVKRTIGGSGRAGKPEINRMVCNLLGLDDPPAEDAADALAIAACHLQQTGGGFGSRARSSVQNFRETQ